MTSVDVKISLAMPTENNTGILQSTIPAAEIIRKEEEYYPYPSRTDRLINNVKITIVKIAVKIFQIAVKIFKAIRAVVHGIKASAKNIGKGFVYSIKSMGKCIGKLGALIAKLTKVVAKALISHPLHTLGLMAGTVCLIMFAPLLINVSATIASIAKVALSAGATAITYVPTIVTGSVKVLANVIGYVPKACSAIIAAAKFILRI